MGLRICEERARVAALAQIAIMTRANHLTPLTPAQIDRYHKIRLDNGCLSDKQVMQIVVNGFDYVDHNHRTR